MFTYLFFCRFEALQQLAYGPSQMTPWINPSMRGTPTNSFGWDFMLIWGAKYNPSIYAGEWWRWVTSLLLHQNFNHILSNLVSARGVGMTVDPECTVAGLTGITACMVLMAVSPACAFCESSHKATSTCWYPFHCQPLLVFVLPCTTCHMNLMQYVPPDAHLKCPVTYKNVL